jgi:NAD(P)-dependent dehydrogenase (short-subunit alcohol dehydrogenase family)
MNGWTDGWMNGWMKIAKNFVAAGANVMLTSRSDEACRTAAEEISCPHYVASNVSNREGCERLAQHVSDVFDNRLHVLINNAVRKCCSDVVLC